MKAGYGRAIAILIVSLALGAPTQAQEGRQDRVYRVRLTGLGFVERPILCRDLATVDLMYRWAVAHLRDGMANAMTRGAFGRTYGTSTEPPLDFYGCVSVPNGTLALVMPGYAPNDPTAPLTVNLSEDTVYTGVTMMREFKDAQDRGPPAQ